MNAGIRSGRTSATVLLGLVLLSHPTHACAGEDRHGLDERTGELVREVADLYRGLKSLQVKAESGHRYAVGPETVTMTQTFEIALRRPAELAIRLIEGGGAVSVVSDGEKLHVLDPVEGRYTENKAPKDLDGLQYTEGGMMLMHGGTLFLTALYSSDPYTTMLDGVTRGEYLGRTDLDGTEAHHMKFHQDRFDWEMWVATGGKPTILRCTMDMSKWFAELAEEDPDLKGMESTYWINFRGWRLDEDLPGSTFAFTPPAGAEKIDSFMDAFDPDADDHDGPHVTLGEPAPDFELDLLDGGTVRLSDHKGKHVVILDFWATWCGPCVRALPVVAGVAKDYADKGVVFYAANLEEEPDTIRRTLERREIECAVALDTDGGVSDDYEVRGIPHMTIIDKEGVIQVVHVGFGADQEQQLRDEIEAVLKGEDLASRAIAAFREGETIGEVEAGRTSGEIVKGLESAWMIPGQWGAVVADPKSETVFALTHRGTCVRFDGRGRALGQSRLRGMHGGTLLRTARLGRDGGVGLLGFSTWGRSLTTYDAEGERLWSYTEGMGINEVAAGDLTGDGRDEIVIGYNGFSGIHVLDADGDLVWKFGEIANVWHVTIGDVTGDGHPEVVTTSASGDVHVFDRKGERLHVIKSPGGYATWVETARFRATDDRDTLLVEGSGLFRSYLVAMNLDGGRLWRCAIGGRTADIHDGRAAPGGAMMALVTSKDVVKVVDLGDGRIIAEAGKQGDLPGIAWLAAGDGERLLIVATDEALNAFRVVPAKGD